MGYELYFRARQHAGMDEARFLDYFQHRPCYQVQDGQAWYVNEATGVDFCFTLTPLPDALAPRDGHYPVVLHIGYLRPDYLIQEVEPEVTAFVRCFELQVADSQAGGMGEGEYDPILLVSGWNSGNELAYAAMLQHGSLGSIYDLPSLQLRRIWRWNYRRAERQARLGSATLVPEIQMREHEGAVITVVEWPDGCAAIIPPADYLLIPRTRLAPRRWWRAEPDCTLVEWKQMAPLLQLHGQHEVDGAIALQYRQIPRSLEKMIRRLAPGVLNGGLLKPAQILTRELVHPELLPVASETDKGALLPDKLIKMSKINKI